MRPFRYPQPLCWSPFWLPSLLSYRFSSRRGPWLCLRLLHHPLCLYRIEQTCPTQSSRQSQRPLVDSAFYQLPPSQDSNSDAGASAIVTAAIGRSLQLRFGQQMLLWLPHCVARYSFYGNESPRSFERSQRFPAALLECRRIHFRTGDEKGHRDFAAYPLRHSDHGCLGHFRLFEQYFFDLPRIDVEASTNDQIVPPAA